MLVTSFTLIAALFTLIYGVKFKKLSLPLLILLIPYLIFKTPTALLIGIIIGVSLFLIDKQFLNYLAFLIALPFIFFTKNLAFILIALSLGIIIFLLSLKFYAILNIAIIAFSAAAISLILSFTYYLSIVFTIGLFLIFLGLGILLNKQQIKPRIENNLTNK